MPIVKYRCRNCGKEAEIFYQRLKFPSSYICDACNGTMIRQYGSVGVTFKGDGYYVNESRPSNQNRGESSD